MIITYINTKFTSNIDNPYVKQILSICTQNQYTLPLPISLSLTQKNLERASLEPTAF